MPGRVGRRGVGPGRRPVVAAAATGAEVAGSAGAARRGAPVGNRYRMRQRMFAIGDDFYIEDEQGRRAFKVDGKALRVRSTLKFEDASGREPYKIQEKLARVRDSMTIERTDGGAAARVHDALITPLRDRLDDQEAAEFGDVIDRLIGIADGAGGELSAGDDGFDPSFGLGPDQLATLAEDLEPGHSVGLLLFEHTWAAELKAAIRTTGGYPIAQGFLTPEAAMMVGAEVRAIAEAEAAIELADAVAGAAMPDAMAAVAEAEDIKTRAAIETVQALMVSGLTIDAAAEQAIEALVAAELVESAAVDAAAGVVSAAAEETDEALAALRAAESAL